MDKFMAILTSRRDENRITTGTPYLWPLILLALVLLVITISIFGSNAPVGGEEPTPTDGTIREARVYTISYRFGLFSPTNLRIHQGDTVRWRNDSSQAIRVVAVLDPGEQIPVFDSVGTIEPGAYFSYVFSTAGVFEYYNENNDSQTGTIIVR